jgi:hypothetical protein
VQAVRPLSLALAFFGVIAGAATLLLVYQAVSRRLRQGQNDQEVLRSLGASPRALALAGLAGPTIALALGAIVAALLAYAASPLMPLGVVRRVEVARGLDADWTVLGLGALALFVLLAIAAIVAGVRGLPHRRTAHQVVARHSHVVGAATRAGMPPSAVTGLRLAFEPGDGSTAVPVRSVMVGGAVAIMTVVAALTFGASFHTLLRSPELYGWKWDSAIYDLSGYGNLSLDAAHERLDGNPAIAGWSGAFFGADSVDGLNLPLLGMPPGSKVVPPLLSGRMIESADEIVLGSATADALRKHVGDEVHIGAGTELRTLRVVGTATFPTIGISHGAHTSLGVGALVVPELVPGFDRFASGEGPAGTQATAVGPPVIFVRFAPGASQDDARALVEGATASMGQFPGSAVVVGAQRPAEIVNSSDVGSVPALLAAILGAAAAVSLAIALASSVRRRRREFALLQSLGFTRRQLAASIAWQATITIGVGVVVGVPLGIALGRNLWTSFADQLDVVPQSSIPVVLLLVVIGAALVIANVAAAFPARMARRVHPMVTLRIE